MHIYNNAITTIKNYLALICIKQIRFFKNSSKRYMLKKMKQIREIKNYTKKCRNN
jgi:hypothetical protein